MANMPDFEIQEAFLAPTSRMIRRVEIFEQDGTTPWREDLWPHVLVGGSVTVDYDRDERRNFDIELDNSTGELNPKAGGLWYDKIFKVFYGIKLDQEERDIRIAVIEEWNSPGQAQQLKLLLSSCGVPIVHFMPMVTRYDEVQDYDVIVSISNDYPRKMTLLNECFKNGKSILTFAPNCTVGQLPLLLGTVGAAPVTAASERVVTPSSIVHPLTVGWSDWSTAAGTTYRKIITAATGAVGFATGTDEDNGAGLMGIGYQDFGGARWVHTNKADFMLSSFGSSDPVHMEAFARYACRAATWANPYTPKDNWEAQLGEFLADGISDSSANNDRIKVVGRDMTKRCINSKFVTATTFKSTQPIEEVIKAVASNAGITKLDIPPTGTTLGKDQTWERDTSRWEVIKEIAQANNYEIYFNARGYLTMRKYLDPLLSPPALHLTTGLGGNLVSRGAKTSDSKLFNHVVVVGESSDSKVPPVYAEAVNDNPSSSSNRAEIGDRVTIITSSLITDRYQAQALAESTLAVSSLEEFELQFTCTLLPWVEPGEIIQMENTQDRYWGPDRYLLSSLTLPLDLSPMSGTGKRIIKVA